MEDYYCYAAAALHLVADVEKVNSNVTHLFNVSYPRARAVVPLLLNLSVTSNQSYSSSVSQGHEVGVGQAVLTVVSSLLTVLGRAFAVVVVAVVCIFQCITVWRWSAFTTRSPSFAPSSAR